MATVIQRTMLVLSSTSTDFTTVRDRVQAANASKVSYTPTDTEISFTATDVDVADLRMIDCLIPDAERTATNAAGDLSSINTGSIDTSFFRMELSTDAVIPIMAPDLLGRTSRAPIFVRQEKGSDYGAGHGKTWRDALDGFEDALLPAAWATDTTYWMCGFLVATLKTGAGPKDRDPVFQDAAGAVTRWRMDYPLDPGMLHIGYKRLGNSTNNQFTQPDASFPRVWKAPNTSDGRWLTPIDPTLSTTDIYTNYLFKDVSSQNEINAEEMTRWYDGTDLWIHMPDDTDPTDRIATSTGQGWNPSHGYMNTAVPLSGYQGLEFINCQFMGGSITAGAGLSKDSDGLLADGFPQAKFLGGRALVGCSFKPKDVCIDGTEWGRSTDGDILFDASDRPDPVIDKHIQTVVTRHGSDQKTWNEMPRFLEIDSSEEGIYWFHGGTTNNPDDGVISGVLFRHIGTRHPVLQAKLGADGYDDIDAHALGNQGASNWDMGWFYIEKAGSAINWYSISDTTNAQNLQNNAIHDFVIRDSNQKFGAGAGQNGIAFNGDGQAYGRSNGTGLYDGNNIRRGVVHGMIGDPDGTKFGVPGIISDGVGISAFSIDEQFVDNVTISNCTHAFSGQRNADMALGEGGGTDVTNPISGARAGPQLRAHNCYWDQIIERILYMRTTNWDPALKTIVSITQADPAVVEVTGHGFPDIAQADVYIEPEIYFANMVGMTELGGNVYKCVWVDADNFSLQTLAGVNVDSTGFGSFTSGDVARSNIGYVDLQKNTLILRDGETASTDKYRYENGNQTLAELQALTRDSLPGARNNVLEVGTVIE